MVCLDFLHFVALSSPRAVGDAGSAGQAWLDKNGNGIKDIDDSRLGGVCIISSVSDYFDTDLCENMNYLTGSVGKWNGGEFYPGVSCKGVKIQAYLPKGMKATTLTKINDCFGSFGFALISLNP